MNINFAFTPYAVPALLSAMISLVTMVFVAKRPKTKSGLWLIRLMGAVLFWSFWNAFELCGTNLSTKVLFSQIQYIAIVFIPIIWFVFILHYTNRESLLIVPVKIFLLIIPLISLTLVLTNGYHHLFWTALDIRYSDQIVVFAPTYGIGFAVHTLYSYALMVLGVVFLISSLVKLPRFFRKQISIILVAALIPLIYNLLYVFDASPITSVDLTPFTFSISGVIIGIGLYYYKLLDIVPIAKEVVVQNLIDGIIILDINNLIVNSNDIAKKMLRKYDERYIGKSVESEIFFWSKINIDDNESDSFLPVEIDFDDNGLKTFYEINIRNIKTDKGSLIGRLVIMRDVSERKKLEEKLKYLATHDPLTGLSNRAEFREYLTESIFLASQKDRKVTVLFIDLDDFKKVNDRYGHDAGDQILIAFSKRLLKNVRDGDMVARMSGDEFLILLEQSSRDAAEKTAVRILEMVEQTFRIEDHNINISASIGISMFPDNGLDGETLVKNADISMYKAKLLGKNQYQFYCE